MGRERQEIAWGSDGKKKWGEKERDRKRQRERERERERNVVSEECSSGVRIEEEEERKIDEETEKKYIVEYYRVGRGGRESEKGRE